MRKIIKEVSLIEFESKVAEMNFNRWYYDGEKKQGLVILNKENE